MKTYAMLALLIFATLTLFPSCEDDAAPISSEIAGALMSADLGAREDGYRSLQSSLLNDAGLSAAAELTKFAERPRSVRGGLIRESIDLSSITIQYYSVNPGDVLPDPSAPTGEAGELLIVDYGPEGELPAENSRPGIYVMFNQPMVPLARLGEPITESSLLKIEPPVPGIYRWYGTKTLSFRPDAPLIESPRYRLTVPDDVESLFGVRLGEEFSFDVFGEKVKMVNLFPGNDADAEVDAYDVPTDIARFITLEFNQPVDPAVVAESLSVEIAGRRTAFTPGRPDYPDRLADRTQRGVLLTLSDEPAENARVVVTLGEGARPLPGYPATDRDQTWNFRTIRPFRAEELSAYPGGFPRDNRPSLYPVYLRFTHPLDETAPLGEFSIRVNGSPVRPEDIRLSWSTLAIYLPDIRPGDTVDVDVPGGILDVYGRENQAENLSTEIPRPSPLLDFPSQYDGLRHLESEFKPSFVWTSRNITEGRLGIMGTPTFFDKPELSPKIQDLDFSGTPRDLTVFHEEDLTPFLTPQGHGTARVRYEMRQDPEQVDQRWQWKEDEVAIQVTDLGLSIRVAYDRILIWVNRLSTGSPVAESRVTAFNRAGRRYEASTDQDGLAVIHLPDGAYRRDFADEDWDGRLALYVRAEKDGDLAEMRVRNTNEPWSFGVYTVRNPEDIEEPVHRIHMFTDRGLYKGGEEIALRGIHWIQSPRGFDSRQGSYEIRIVNDFTGQEVWTSDGRTSESGGFSHRLDLPEDLEPGPYSIVYEGSGFYGYAGFRVASFRRASFQVNTEVTGGPWFHGDTLEASVKADYLAGGALPAADYHYYWTRKPVNYRPPGNQWQNWNFGTTEWAAEQSLSSGDGNLSGAGSARISEGTVDHEVTGKAYRYTLETTVEDVDRQVISSVVSTVVHPAEAYIAARFDSGDADGWWSRFIPVGDEVSAVGRLVGIDGETLSTDGSISIGLIKGEWTSARQQGLYGRLNTRWEYVETELWRDEAVLKNGSVKRVLSVDDPGSYTLYFEYTDEKGRPARTEVNFYATGSGWVQQASRTPGDINMIVDKSIYEPGDTARILIQSPVPSGRYLLTLEREGILEERIVELEGSHEVIEVPVKEDYLPVFHVALTSFTERTEIEEDYFEPDLGRPRSLFGLTTVHVATTPVELDVDVEPGKESYGPGDEAEMTVRVSRDGKPVNGAEVTLLAVDRGVLDLIGYHIPNPLDFFYDENHFPHAVAGDDSRRLLLRPVTYEISNLQGGGSAKDEERKDFNPLALFEPEIRTGADGTARVRVTLPDNLSAYRLTAVALKGVRLGYDEDEFRVSNPINIRTALPRRFRNRDTSAAGVVLTNTTDQDQRVTVSVESDILSVVGEEEKSITLPGGSTTELPFVLEAHAEGRGVIRFTTRSTVLNEVLEEPVIVERPVVTESFATIGVLRDEESEASEVLVLPAHSSEGFGVLHLTADSSLRPYIGAAMERLEHIAYPSMNDKLYHIAVELADGRSPALSEEVFAELADMQFPDGGIGYRRPSLEYARSSWFLSALTAHTSLEMSNRFDGYDNPLNIESLEEYLLTRLNEAKKENAVSFTAAWSAWILARSGAIAPDELAWLRDGEDRLGIAGYNLLSMAYGALGREKEAEGLYARAKKFVTFGTRSVDVAETYEKRSYFSSGRAETALLLMNAAERGEDDEILLRLAGSLNGEANSRRFTSFFDDYWTLMGFLPLLEEEPSRNGYGFMVEVGGTELLETRLGVPGEGTWDDSFPLDAEPMNSLEKNAALPMSLRKDGEGSLYYSSTLTYALPTETAMPRDEGIEVFAQVESLDGKEIDENKLPLGETLRMRVTLNTLSRRSFLKLTVPIPSGAEIVDPELCHHRCLPRFGRDGR
jgi:uncharacterized protein YfaS (alpha-2-macroglobulin family)